MGTGVGEAMLIGAAVGATTGGAGAAIQGGDPLKGALIGGAMGAVGGGLGAAAPAATTATTATTAGASGASGAAGASAVPGTLSAGAPTVGISSAGTGAVGGGTLPGATISSVAETGAGISGVGSGSGTLGSAGFSDPGIRAPLTGPLGTSTGITGGISPNVTAGLSAPGPTPPSGTNILGYRPGEEGYLSNARLGAIGATSGLSGLMQAERAQYSGGPPMQPEKRKSSFDPASFAPSKPTYAPEGVYVPEYKDYRTAAEGGIMRLAVGGTVDDEMGGDDSAIGMDQGNMQKGLFGMGYAEGGVAEILELAKAQGLTPQAYQQIYGRGNRITEMDKALKEGQIVDGMASGGISSLGGYSDGGRMLKGPGDGMSDSIPASIANKQPARLADGEFVVPADVVSHLGNGSTDAGAKKLYAMMDKVRKARTGNKKQGKQIKANQYMPA